MKKILNFIKTTKLKNICIISILLFLYVFICAQNYVSAVSNTLSILTSIWLSIQDIYIHLVYL